MLSRQVFGVPTKQSGGPADRAALSIRELQARVFDDETWLSDAQTSETDAREVPLATQRLKVWGRMEKPPLCRQIVCKRTCQAPAMIVFPGRRWNK
eukprot:3710360-Amphidinium_carterae.2